MKSFFELTAWQMARPKPYGPFHIICAAAGIAAAIIIAYSLRRLKDKKIDRVVLCAGCFLLLTEIYKQLFLYYVVNNGKYDFWYLPFQLCSIPMYLCLIAPFLRNNALKSAIYMFMSTFTLMSGIIVFVDPPGMLFSYITLTAHSFAWHFVLVFLGFFLALARRGSIKKHDFIHAVYLYLGLCAIAFALNVVLWEFLGKQINMFYLGPMNSGLLIFGDITNMLGWYINAPIYIASTILGAFVCYKIIKGKNRNDLQL